MTRDTILIMFFSRITQLLVMQPQTDRVKRDINFDIRLWLFSFLRRVLLVSLSHTLSLLMTCILDVLSLLLVFFLPRRLIMLLYKCKCIPQKQGGDTSLHGENIGCLLIFFFTGLLEGSFFFSTCKTDQDFQVQCLIYS